jgi:hypothetical protein
MEATLAVLNDLVAQRFIEKSAIGGPVGAIFWAEPFDTVDLDVFVLLPASAPPLEPLREVFFYLKERGCDFEGEFLLIEGVPVQFLPAEDPKGLTKAALQAAATVSYEGASGAIPTWVLTPEYLIAIALDVHRSKDYERISRLLGQAPVNRVLVDELIGRFGLEEFWSTFLRRYPEFA